jgi:hypothetical protein
MLFRFLVSSPIADDRLKDATDAAGTAVKVDATAAQYWRSTLRNVAAARNLDID